MGMEIADALLKLSAPLQPMWNASMREMLTAALAEYGESDKDIIRANVNDWNEFIIWTEKRVYFATEKDDAYYLGTVPRDPCDETPKAI